jgi:hypothetical protein
MKMKLIGLTGLLAILAVVLVFWLRHESRFAADLRNAAATVASGIEICDFRDGETRGCVTFADNAKDSALSNLTRSLSDASPSTPPGKVPIVRERILRIRGHAVGQYARCYRVIEFTGFPDEYVNEVEMDSSCSRVNRYGSGYANIRHIQ